MRTPKAKRPSGPPSTRPKPRLFIGSSSEGKEIARLFDTELQDVCVPVPWWDAPEFREMMRSTLASLFTAARSYDFALLIFTPDDDAISRGDQVWLVRDNVMFECGLFAGTLGPERTFAVVQKPGHADSSAKDTKLPSDLAGLNIPRFAVSADTEETKATVRTATRGMRDTIRKIGRNPPGIDLTDGYSVRDSFCSLTVKAEYVNDSLDRLKESNLLLIGKKMKTALPYLLDTNLARSTPRAIAGREHDNFVMKARYGRTFTVQDGEEVACILLWIPPGVDIEGATNLRELQERGCHQVGGGTGKARGSARATVRRVKSNRGSSRPVSRRSNPSSAAVRRRP